ncbi:MAG: hypothetical protein IH943_12595 [Acidobacteria bacterium]|nr:hypothetical protein [Acidobacteriota bacterium]
MERAGILVRRLPNRGYRELKKLLDPLADEWPDADQMTKMGILRDSQVHPSEGMWREVMPSDDSIDRIRKGLVAVRPHASTYPNICDTPAQCALALLDITDESLQLP